MAGPSTALSAFLRAKRALLTPEQAGLPVAGPRRVPGLRREEVAQLAGISPDYLMRLEQGRGHRPSAQVLGALAAALQLDGPSTAHLHQLARQSPQRAVRPERVPASLLNLLDTLEGHVSGFVQSRFMDVLAANRLASALSPSFVVGANVLREAFLDPRIAALYDDWDDVVREATAGLRAATATHAEAPRLLELVAELSEQSARFRELWARHDVVPRSGGRRVLHHPVVGRLELHHEKLVVAGAGGLLLVLHHAVPGTESAAALARLAEGLPEGPA